MSQHEAGNHAWSLERGRAMVCRLAELLGRRHPLVRHTSDSEPPVSLDDALERLYALLNVRKADQVGWPKARHLIAAVEYHAGME